GHLTEQCDGAHIEHVSSCWIEAADSALAKDNREVAAKCDILGGHQKLIERRCESPLEDHRFVRPPDSVEKGEILHVPRTHLECIGVLRNERHVFGTDDFGNGRNSVCERCLTEHSQTLLAQSLERVRRCARLKRSTA